MFRFFQIFFKVEAGLSYSKSIFFNILYPASANELSADGNSIFFLLELIGSIRNH